MVPPTPPPSPAGSPVGAAPDAAGPRVAMTLEQCWHRVPGGTATSAIESIRALLDRGGTDLVGVAARHREPPAPAFRPPIEVRQLPLPRLALYESWHRLRRPAVQAATGPVDVIHVTGMAMPPKTAPMVVTVHDLAFLHDPSLFTRRGVSFFHRAVDLARADADIVVCPSAATVADCVAHGFEPERLRLVPWGIRVDPASPDAVAAVRERLGLDRPYVMWTGTIEPRKNLPALVDAFGRLGRDDVDLVIGGPEGWNDELAALEARATGRMRRVGFLPVDDLRALYAGASVFCFPSTREGFGLPVLEAMAQGTPVVTSSGTSTAEIVGDGGAGVLVDPHDRAALADALAGLLDDPDRARAVGAAGLERAHTFSWRRTADGLVAAYDDARNVGGSPPASVVDPRMFGSRGARARLAIAVNLLWLVPGEVGGSETYAVRLLQAWAEDPPDDLELTVFVNGRFPAAYPDLVATHPTVVAPVSGSSRGLRVATETTWLGRQLRDRGPALVHHLGGTAPPWRPTPTIVTIHDLQPLVLPEHFSLVKRGFIAATVPPSVRTASHITTLSRFVADDVTGRLGVPEARVTVVPPGLDPVPPGSDTGAAAERVRRTYGLDDRPFFLYPAITYPHKNHLVLVEAFAELCRDRPEPLLVLAGGVGGDEDRLREALDRFGIGDRVRRTGRVPQADLEVLYRQATALVFPSRYEGFGIPTLEAMQRRCPVIAADATGLPAVVGDAACLVPPDAPAAWSAAMATVLDDGAARDRLIAAGIARAATFNWQRSVALLADVYRRTASS